MSQMRKDVFTGRWVIVAETDALQPSDFRFKPFVRDAAFCPFCETNEASTPPEVFAIRPPGSMANGPGWSVRVVPNSRPHLRIEGELGKRGEGFHDLMNGIGVHEIIAETPRHDRSLHELEPEEISGAPESHHAQPGRLGDMHVCEDTFPWSGSLPASEHGGADPIGPRSIRPPIAQAFADRAQSQGADVVLETWEDMNHDFQLFGPNAPQSAGALRRLGEVIDARVRGREKTEGVSAVEL